MKKTIAYALLSSAFLFGCESEDTSNPDPNPNPNPSGEIDQTLLAEYRAAVPSMSRLAAEAPVATQQNIIGEPALYPSSSYDIVTGINGAVSGIILTLEAIVATPPTIYNSETKEFFWGPFENEDSIGYVAAYIREAAPGADFRYEYALLRGIDNDVANLVPVIWGGATPDERNEDYGAGVTMWDFEANRAFEEEHNPAYDTLALDQGRFVALYFAGPDENNPAAEVGVVLAVFRNFVPSDAAEGAQPADLDYLYGRVIEGELTFDFLDWEAGIDVSDPADKLAENVGVRMAFINEGAGRAEADVEGGSFAANQNAKAVECWDNAVDQTYIEFEVFEDGASIAQAADGDSASCGLFETSLTDLGVPSLDSVDAELRAILDQVATTGIPAE